MLRAQDIPAGKIIVQLGLLPAHEVLSEIKTLDTSPGDVELVERLVSTGKLGPEQAAAVRDKLQRFRWVRDEASYINVVQEESLADKTLLQKLLIEIERRDKPVRIGSVLVVAGFLTDEQDAHVLRKRRRRTDKDDAAILERYKAQGFSGIAKPLLPSLDAAQIRTSLLLGLKLKAEGPVSAEIAEWIRKARERRDPTTAELEADREKKRAQAKEKAEKEKNFSVADVHNLKRIADQNVVELLGSGGAGAVFLGEKEGRYSAIKVLLNQAATAAQRGRFEREIAVMKRLNHKNVIRLLDSGKTDEGVSYLVVPALVGKDLSKLLEARKGQGLAPAVAAHIMEEVLEGLGAVHAAGLMHRDIKPQNIYVLAGLQQEVRLLDFGLAKLEKEDESAGMFQTVTAEIVGTPAYIAPEQVGGHKTDRRADLYSLGIVFFELLTGKLPFESDTAQGYLRQHLAFPPPTLAETREERPWPAELEKLIERMLAKTPDERPQSCAEILATLRAGVFDKLKLSSPEGAAPEPVDPTKKYGDHGLVAKLGE